jgi:hypothetical protein
MSQRIKKPAAELVDIPPTTWYTRQVRWLIDQDTFQENVSSIPLNIPLKESLERDGMINPLLVMPNWWPIAGSQRLRAATESKNEKLLNQFVRVARFDKEWWNAFFLWPDVELRNKMIQVYFQCIETAWKSQQYIAEVDKKGKPMLDFEKEGDELKGWQVREAEEKMKETAKLLGADIE